MSPQEQEARKRAIAAQRAAGLESNRAMTAVINASHDLSEARRKLAAATVAARGGVPPNRFAEHLAECEAELAQAENYARTACPDRLSQLHDDMARAEAAADRKRTDDEAERLAGQREAKELGRAQTDERARAKAIRAEQAAALMKMGDLRESMA